MVKIKWETQDYLTVLLAVFLAHKETEETMSQRQIYFLGMVAPYKKKKKAEPLDVNNHKNFSF